MIIIENDIYVVVLPEHGIRQGFDAETREPFASQAVAQAYEDKVIAGIAATQAAAAAAATEAEQARLAGLVHLEIVADKTEVAVDTAVNIVATLKSGLGATVPLDQAFAVPIENSDGQVEMIKGVTFVAGSADVSITFTRSGYFRITEAGINRKLEGTHIGLPAPFEVTVFE